MTSYLQGRRFQIWDYSPSLSRLLLRSPKYGDEKLNVDIVFHGVKHIDIPSTLDSIMISEERIDSTYTRYIIHSKDKMHRVDAISVSISESDTDIFDSPLNQL